MLFYTYAYRVVNVLSLCAITCTLKYSLFSNQQLQAVNMTKPRVIVIGAGMAGLSAAQHLYKHGFHDVQVLEASHRCGGRMQTVQFGNTGHCIVELGANWIHGAALSNPIISLANQHNLLTENILLDRTEGYCYRSDGQAIPRHISDPIWKIFKKIEAEANSLQQLPDGIESYKDYIQRRFYEEAGFQKPDVGTQKDIDAVFNNLMNYLNFHMGGYPEEISALWSAKYVAVGGGVPGGNVKVPPGMASITQALVKQLPDNCIRYGQEVTRIKWDNPEEVTLLCRNSCTHTAKHVIITVSLGHLKEHFTSLFHPSLPQSKIEAINHSGYGKVSKIFLRFEHPFWKEGDGGIKLAWTKEEAGICSKSEWYKKIFSFDEVLNNSHVLVAWVSGDEGEHMETLSNEEVAKTCGEVIRKFLGDTSIPDPVSIIKTKWCIEPLSLGSYSYASKHCKTDGYKELEKPVGHPGYCPNILFAGEATHSKFHSTIHGARLSGIREADRLLNMYEMNMPSRL